MPACDDYSRSCADDNHCARADRSGNDHGRTHDHERCTAASTVAPATTTSVSGCHPSYQGACVPAGVSDVDCAGGGGDGPASVSVKNFSVVGPDAYDLDRDGDGIACES